MEYTLNLFADFLNKLIIFDKDCNSAIKAISNDTREHYHNEEQKWEKIRLSAEEQANDCFSEVRSITNGFQTEVNKVFSTDIDGKAGTFTRLQKCKEYLSIISSAKKSIIHQEMYQNERDDSMSQISMNVEEIIQGKIDFVDMAYRLNELSRGSKRKEIANSSAQFNQKCKIAEDLLNREIIALRSLITQNRNELDAKYQESARKSHLDISSKWESTIESFLNTTNQFKKQKETTLEETLKVTSENTDKLKKHLDELAAAFFKKYQPQEFADEYFRLYSMEPSYKNYECYKEMPKNVHISTLDYEISVLNISEYTKSFLEKYYPFMYKDNKLSIPYCASFGAEFNYLFKFNEEGRSNVVKNACDLGMRLFMMLPPGKLNFTFVDPVRLGESFAMFNRLVDVDDRTSEVINGKIWSAPADIEQKLRIMTDHISNVTQRCLQGKYDNIYEYNRVAEQNAEAYQVLMLMDFPAGLTEQSLKLLEQIVTSGPKCGVFTMIYQNESQYKKISERSYPLISNIENSFQVFHFNEDGTQIVCSGEKIKDKPILWKSLLLPEQTQLDQIIAILKKGIKNADKVVISIDKIDDAESTNSTKNGIRIPIGIHGAKEIQYLTLGVGGSHHALIAGVAGSGKSSLLHTIILRTLKQYSPDELSIYLVDFKRGVEFKIYADFDLPSFKVIAIESEREFGYNILLALEREQKIRADIFKKNHVDKIEEYRENGGKMPRILVIMDEFHELFSNANDEFAKKSATIMERIVRQGRAFGVHLILASQSYSNITGVDRAVFDQMAVRVVLKCSKADANLLLDNGSAEIDQISIDDPGRAVYNSEAGNKEYNSHFRVAYIPPERHREMLQEISDDTISYRDKNKPTRILLSNIEDNMYSVFNRFTEYEPDRCSVTGRLYIGEPLSITNEMNIDLIRNDNCNLLMLGNDTEKARSMFAFAMLSICINYRVKYGKVPDKPFIYLLNCKPLDDSYFKDIPKILAKELLPEYIRYIHCGDENSVKEVLVDLHDDIKDTDSAEEIDKFFFVFGYQRAEELKSEIILSQDEDIDNLFNLIPGDNNKLQHSAKEMFQFIVKNGAKRGIHVVLWQDSYSALEQDDNNIMSYFNLKIAFDMSPEEFSRSVGVNDTSLMSENNAIYYNKARDNQKFRPYQMPDEEWLKSISNKLHKSEFTE